MYAIAFDLSVAVTAAVHPKGVRRAYDDIERALGRFGFRRIQGSLYLSDHNDLAKLTAAIVALKQLPWFPEAVGDIRGFKADDWSDFTAFVKGAE